jgi:Zn-dependent protease with chaperone function
MHIAHVSNGDIVASAILSMVFPCLVLLLLTMEYFFLLFWPSRMYTRWYNSCKKWIITGVTVGMTATAIISTVNANFLKAMLDAVTDQPYGTF